MHTFRKAERLCSKLLIKKLFDQGAAIAAFPFRSIWMEVPFNSAEPVQIAISVAKKKFKRAVDRNRLKRQIREAYRLNKFILWEPLQKNRKNCLILFIYTPNTFCTFLEIESKIKVTLQQIQEKIVYRAETKTP